MNFFLLALCLVAAVIPQLAEGGRVRRDIETAQMLVKLLDADKDGRLNQEEASATVSAEEPFYFHIIQSAEMFKKVDRNGDGFLDAQEIEVSGGPALALMRKRHELLEEIKKMMSS